MNFERKNPRLKDFDYSSQKAYFITICTKDKRLYFRDDNFNNQTIDCLVKEKIQTNFLVYVYCLMPDHIHLLLSPPGNGLTVPQFIGRFKSKTTHLAWKFEIDDKLWQKRFYDHIIRKKENLEKIGQYILNNPIRKGLVEKWKDYKYCDVLDSW